MTNLLACSEKTLVESLLLLENMIASLEIDCGMFTGVLPSSSLSAHGFDVLGLILSVKVFCFRFYPLVYNVELVSSILERSTDRYTDRQIHKYSWMDR